MTGTFQDSLDAEIEEMHSIVQFLQDEENLDAHEVDVNVGQYVTAVYQYDQLWYEALLLLL